MRLVGFLKLILLANKYKRKPLIPLLYQILEITESKESEFESRRATQRSVLAMKRDDKRVG